MQLPTHISKLVFVSLQTYEDCQLSRLLNILLQRNLYTKDTFLGTSNFIP